MFTISDILFLCLPMVFPEQGTNRLMQIEIVTLGTVSPAATSFSLTNISPAMDSAVNELREQYGNVFNLTHTYITDKQAPVDCMALMTNSDFMLSEWYYKRKVSADLYAYIAPGCTEFENVNRLTAGWNILMLTTGAGGSPAFRNKTISPTRVTTAPISMSNFATLLQNLLDHFGWSSVYLFSDDANVGFYLSFTVAAVDVIQGMSGSQLRVRRVNSKTQPVDYASMLKEFRLSSRGHAPELRQFLISATQLNMTNGEFVYICVEYQRGNDEMTWKFQDGRDEISREAFRSVLVIAPDDSIYNLPPAKVCELWKNESQRIYNVKSQLYYTAGNSYAAFKIFGTIVNETLSLNPTFDFNDGKKFVKLFFNRTYKFNFTEIFLDTAGERITKLVVRDLDPQSGILKPVFYQDPIQRKLHFLDHIDWGGPDPSKNSAPLNEPVCGYRGDSGPCSYQGKISQIYSEGFGTAFLCSIIGACVFAYWYLQIPADSQKDGFLYATITYHVNGPFLFPLIAHATCAKWTIARKQNQRWWIIDENYLRSFVEPHLIKRNPIHSASNGYRAFLLNEEVWVDSVSTTRDFKTSYTIDTTIVKATHEKLLPLFRQLRNSPHHNINAFRGVCFSRELPFMYIISCYCQRGSLHDIFESSVHSGKELSSSLSMDFLDGMSYIRTSVLKFHGSISGWNCLIDSRFTLKISKLGFAALQAELLPNLSKQHNVETSEKLFWTAPELLRGEMKPNKLTEIYSVGIVLYEILTMSPPFVSTRTSTAATEIINKIRLGGKKPLRPDVDFDTNPVPSSLFDVISTCWNEIATKRPKLKEVRKIFSDELTTTDKLPTTFVEKLLSRLDEYARVLEDEVAARTTDLIAEQRNCDRLLEEMLPRIIISKLRNSEAVDAEMFDSVTVMFTDTYGFSKCVTLRTPLEITEQLNALYSVFDPVLRHFDVYKVETIGNVYMVASGVPVRNGTKHVKEICSLALTLHAIFRTSPAEPDGVFFRAGIHTGACAAGVVGHKNPRYCLFGDSVNTASRISSHSLPDKIHMSKLSAQLLGEFPGFNVTERGTMEIKGKGLQTTFWLNH